MITVNISGHRPFQFDKKTSKWISKIETKKYSARSEELFERLVQLFCAYFERHPVDVVITGMAMGVDLAAGIAAIRCGIEVHAYVPYQGHGSDWKTFYKEVHAEVLEHAEVIKIPDHGFSVSALLQRNKDMVDASDFTLALWDGSKGGTSHCVEYATSKGKKVVNLWKHWSKYVDADAG